MSILPTISVVIPAYNAASFIAETLDSVSRQTRAPLEVLVVDDHSTDDTAEIASRRGATVVSATSTPNRGASSARNDGIAVARGDYVALLDADDLWIPEHLEIVGGILDAHEEAGLAYSRAEKFGDDTGPSRKTIAPGIVQDAFPVAARVNLSLTCCAVFRRRVALELGGFDAGIRYGEDFDFWLRLASRYPVVCTERITARYRIHTVGKGDTRAAAREGQFRARHRMWESLDEEEDAARRRVLEGAMYRAWEDHLRAAWQDGDHLMFDRMLELERFVPEAETVRDRWARKRPFFPLRRLWNGLPDGFRGAIKSVLRSGHTRG